MYRADFEHSYLTPTVAAKKEPNYKKLTINILHHIHVTHCSYTLQKPHGFDKTGLSLKQTAKTSW